MVLCVCLFIRICEQHISKRILPINLHVCLYVYFGTCLKMQNSEQLVVSRPSDLTKMTEIKLLKYYKIEILNFLLLYIRIEIILLQDKGGIGGLKIWFNVERRFIFQEE